MKRRARIISLFFISYALLSVLEKYELFRDRFLIFVKSVFASSELKIMSEIFLPRPFTSYFCFVIFKYSVKLNGCIFSYIVLLAMSAFIFSINAADPVEKIKTLLVLSYIFFSAIHQVLSYCTSSKNSMRGLSSCSYGIPNNCSYAVKTSCNDTHSKPCVVSKDKYSL